MRRTLLLAIVLIATSIAGGVGTASNDSEIRRRGSCVFR